MTSLAVLVTCFNRRSKTIACLAALFNNSFPRHLNTTVFLVDDGSSDGTSAAVNSAFPNVRVIKGSGHLYWGGGMRLAFSEAMESDFDYYLWLNDDTVLLPDTISRLMEVRDQVKRTNEDEVIVVGTTFDALTGIATYGGQIRNRPNRKLSFRLVIPSERPLPCDTINGNCVLIPREVVAKVGNIDSALIHSMGDIDYGLRAAKAGCKLWVMPGYAGTCSTNPTTGTYNDRTLPLRRRLGAMLGPKGLPLSAWKILAKRHTGSMWVMYWLWPYARVLVESVVGKFISLRPPS